MENPNTLLSKIEAARLWAYFHKDWNEADPLPVISWTIEEDMAVLVDLAEAMEHACDFNHWEDLV